CYAVPIAVAQSGAQHRRPARQLPRAWSSQLIRFTSRDAGRSHLRLLLRTTLTTGTATAAVGHSFTCHGFSCSRSCLCLPRYGLRRPCPGVGFEGLKQFHPSLVLPL